MQSLGQKSTDVSGSQMLSLLFVVLQGHRGEGSLTNHERCFTLTLSFKQHAELTVKMVAMSHQDCLDYLEIANE